MKQNRYFAYTRDDFGGHFVLIPTLPTPSELVLRCTVCFITATVHTFINLHMIFCDLSRVAHYLRLSDRLLKSPFPISFPLAHKDDTTLGVAVIKSANCCG